MEAWTREEKDNLSWSHPWASAPGTAIPRGFMGIIATQVKNEELQCKYIAAADILRCHLASACLHCHPCTAPLLCYGSLTCDALFQPAFKRFTIKPQPGDVASASISLPTQAGAIKVSEQKTAAQPAAA